MEAHTLSSVLLSDSTFPSEKYRSSSKKSFRKKEDDKPTRHTREVKSKELRSLGFSDTNFPVNNKDSTNLRSANDLENLKPATCFKGREVVLVDPLDESADYWWPAMIVPPTEIDRSMISRKLERDECLVRYFEDNKFSVCKDSELTHFRPDSNSFNEFSHSTAFLTDPGVLIALNYLQTGELGKKFMWKLWGKDKEVPPIATQPDPSSLDQDPQSMVSRSQTPQRRQLRELKNSSRKRKSAPNDDEPEINHSQETNEISNPSKRNTLKSNACDNTKPVRNVRVKTSHESPAPSRAQSADPNIPVNKPDDKHDPEPKGNTESQPEHGKPMTVKEILKRMKALRREYKRIGRGVRRVAKELIVHKAGDGRITRSMMRRKK
ncbi:hypothetical protein K7432_014469 [Basidiobolus ranarum]|uniref:ARID4A/B PWWP domain-containing protein n=1 Tax=Basidiobolus ranarum TaxID=34480 RepID=A0ABR2VPG0_9FUNG